MKTEKIYKARHNHSFLKEGMSIRFYDGDIFMWKYRDWFPLSIKNRHDIGFWSLHKDSFGNICPNLEHWQLVKENKYFEVGEFYKYRDGFGVLIFQIKNKICSTYFVNLDSSLGFNDTINSFATDSIIYRNSVEATKEDIEYCLKQKAKEKGLCKGKRYWVVFGDGIRGEYRILCNDINDLSLRYDDGLGYEEYELIDGHCVLWRQNEGWIIKVVEEAEYIKTQEGEKKYKGDIVYVVKDNYEVKRVKLVDDGEGGEKINDRKVFSNWYNAMEYAMREMVRSKRGIRKEHEGFTVIDDFSDCKWNYINEWDRKEFSKNDILNLKKRISRRVCDLEVDKQKEILDTISKLFKA